MNYRLAWEVEYAETETVGQGRRIYNEFIYMHILTTNNMCTTYQHYRSAISIER